ncbi:glutathione S-transferase family protein [Pseudomonas songnenensis]|uniref:Glutathione S-transferase family protein n=1 Tax=Pseudomonas songnenensis TaxID=1176259 RepID=A0ABX9UY13_9PSED|nr:glutathione S-transferase family protein [Pseudomonas songnenensis]AWM61359.1 glutathione S-transferase family protein [Stutzerimonas stutzeri]MCQ4299703.1 glutathione S-transferase family protein [Pseudomonas songnenensis]RMH98256.1 glutathione S-transferase family protein [Pseudomonas songnenensis]
MTMTVFGVPLSPFVRKVRLCLLEKGLEYRLETVMPFTPPQWYLEINPLGRIPALKDGDCTLADSSVICQYLEEAYPETAGLYGENAQERGRVRWLEKYADYELAPLTTFTVFRNRILKPTSGHPCNEEAVQAAVQEKLPSHFDYLEGQLGQQQFFVGDSLSMADIAVTCQLINMAHGGEQLDAQRWPNLAAHHARMLALPSVASLLPDEQRMNAKLKEMGKPVTA